MARRFWSKPEKPDYEKAKEKARLERERRIKELPFNIGQLNDLGPEEWIHATGRPDDQFTETFFALGVHPNYVAELYIWMDAKHIVEPTLEIGGISESEGKVEWTTRFELSEPVQDINIKRLYWTVKRKVEAYEEAKFDASHENRVVHDKRDLESPWYNSRRRFSDLMHSLHGQCISEGEDHVTWYIGVKNPYRGRDVKVRYDVKLTDYKMNTDRVRITLIGDPENIDHVQRAILSAERQAA